MCGRFSLTSPIEAMRHVFGFDELPNLGARYNIAPTQDVTVIRSDTDGARELVMMRWGLVPSWAKEIGNKAPLINARGETVAEKPAFRSAFAKRRCLIPADGFYEWKASGTGTKQPYRIALPNNELFAFAGIRELWQSSEGASIESCAIITTAASPQITSIHHRMPVILTAETCDAWLVERNQDLIVSYDRDIRAYPVGTAVNKVVNDEPALWDEVKLDRKGEQMKLF